MDEQDPIVPDYAFQDQNQIHGFFGDYAFLDNAWRCDISMWGVVFSSVETAYQASKFMDIDYIQKIALYHPDRARRFVASHKSLIREDWDTVKHDIMFYLCCQKFLRNVRLLKKLLRTGDRELIYANDFGQDYWGVVDGEGQNKKGKILMRVRKLGVIPS